CPTPTPAQRSYLGQQIAAAAPGILTLSPPDGGWPDGSGPTVCDDPTSQFSVVASQLEASLDAGRIGWNAQADRACRASLSGDADLLGIILPDGGVFPSSAGLLPDGGGACTELLVGQVHLDGGCALSADCIAGLYCRSPGTSGGGCGGSCAAPVPPGHPCGPDDLCADGLDCAAGLCGGSPDAGAPRTSQGSPGAPCQSQRDCATCLVCSAADGGGQACALPPAVGAPCASDSSCATPLQYCAAGSCAPSLLPGALCPTASAYACLVGWCEPTAPGSPSGACLPFSLAGGPCVAGQGCANGQLFCAQDGGSGVPGVCAPLPVEGQPCGTPPWLTTDCANPADWCNATVSSVTGQATGSCDPLPGPAAPCTPQGQCAPGDFCNQGAVCEPLPPPGQPCTPQGRCAPGAYCVFMTGLCASTLPGGGTCSQGTDCQSGQCNGGLCESPCLQSAGGSSGCQGATFSFFLGLGGALIFARRRRRR
ncbi:MAG: hypothetical protein ACYCWW_19875, partial [Deltaproteobacteria bacterium]